MGLGGAGPARPGGGAEGPTAHSSPRGRIHVSHLPPSSYSSSFLPSFHLPPSLTSSPLPPHPLPPLSEQPVTDISCGDGHTCALTGNGIPFCWGDNSAGQLGVSLSTQELCQPRAVSIPTGNHITQVACGANFTVCLSCKLIVFPLSSPFTPLSQSPLVC